MIRRILCSSTSLTPLNPHAPVDVFSDRPLPRLVRDRELAEWRQSASSHMWIDASHQFILGELAYLRSVHIKLTDH